MSVVQWDPPAGVFERWQPELDVIAPYVENGHSSLRLMWEPGEEWDPVNRWTIWEVMPVGRAPEVVRESLMGPNPRDFGWYDRVEKVFRQARHFAVNRQQWQFYQDTGLYGRPVWVCQGVRGGHLRRWTEVLANLSQMNGGPDHPPEMASLEYAEPDRRTIDRLRDIDMVSRWGSILHKLSNMDALRDALDRRERRVAQHMAEQVWKWMEDQMLDAIESVLTHDMAQRFWDEAPDDPNWRPSDPDEDRETFIEEVASGVAF